MWDGPRLDATGAAAAKKYKKYTSSQVLEGAQRVNFKMKISGRQVAAARELLGITQGELAQAIGVVTMTIHRFEAGLAEPYARTLDKIRDELERRGIDFTNGIGPGVRLNLARAAEYSRAAEAERSRSPQ